jgi:diacylglycerol kinase
MQSFIFIHTQWHRRIDYATDQCDALLLRGREKPGIRKRLPMNVCVSLVIAVTCRCRQTAAERALLIGSLVHRAYAELINSSIKKYCGSNRCRGATIYQAAPGMGSAAVS